MDPFSPEGVIATNPLRLYHIVIATMCKIYQGTVSKQRQPHMLATFLRKDHGHFRALEWLALFFQELERGVAWPSCSNIARTAFLSKGEDDLSSPYAIGCGESPRFRDSRDGWLHGKMMLCLLVLPRL